MSFLVLHGVPIARPAWQRISIPLQIHLFRGLATPEPRTDWSLPSFVDEVLPKIDEQTILIGHDFGGVIAAMASIQKQPRALILTGTALGPWWLLTRMSALPILRYFFYDLFAGQLFVRLSNRTGSQFELRPEVAIPNIAQRMRSLANNMSPPKHLAQAIPCPLFLIWGTQDRWYPTRIAKAISQTTNAPITWLNAGHYAMWEDPAAYTHALQNIQNQLLS